MYINMILSQIIENLVFTYQKFLGQHQKWAHNYVWLFNLLLHFCLRRIISFDVKNNVKHKTKNHDHAQRKYANQFLWGWLSSYIISLDIYISFDILSKLNSEYGNCFYLSEWHRSYLFYIQLNELYYLSSYMPFP